MEPWFGAGECHALNNRVVVSNATARLLMARHEVHREGEDWQLVEEPQRKRCSVDGA